MSHGLVVVVFGLVVVAAVVVAVVARGKEHGRREGHAEKRYGFHESCFMVG